jgi:hypothetical protein
MQSTASSGIICSNRSQSQFTIRRPGRIRFIVFGKFSLQGGSLLRRLILPLADRYGAGFLVHCGVAAAGALSEWASFVVTLAKVGPNVAAILTFFVATFINLLLSRSVEFGQCGDFARR